jgi:hypothetical protein
MDLMFYSWGCNHVFCSLCILVHLVFLSDMSNFDWKLCKMGVLTFKNGYDGRVF